jgi:hypothetical protein
MWGCLYFTWRRNSKLSGIAQLIAYDPGTTIVYTDTLKLAEDLKEVAFRIKRGLLQWEWTRLVRKVGLGIDRRERKVYQQGQTFAPFTEYHVDVVWLTVFCPGSHKLLAETLWYLSHPRRRPYVWSKMSYAGNGETGHSMIRIQHRMCIR